MTLFFRNAYEETYGESVKGFTGITDQDKSFYTRVLSRYGLDAMKKYANLGVNGLESLIPKPTPTVKPTKTTVYLLPSQHPVMR